MSLSLAQRQVALAAVTLLAVVVGVAMARALTGADEGRLGTPAIATEWQRALAAPYTFPKGAKRTACGHPTGRRTLGVAHPVLPCGAKISILYEGQEVLTQVVDRGTGALGRDFDITAPLAEQMGLTGIQPIRWRFAQPDG
jgi:rare lipoprotein A (peptidoglycan hydrolase)